MSPLAHRQTYSRDEVVRVLGITERQLKYAERHGLAFPLTTYNFNDLIGLRALFRLLDKHVPGPVVRQSLDAIKEKLEHIRDPLTELRLVREGKRIEVFVGKQRMEALSGQLLLDFDEAEIRNLVAFPEEARARREAQEKAKRQAEALALFEMGVNMEQSGGPVDEIIDVYEQALRIDPECAGAAVNLGTIHFNARDLRTAERYYKKAIDVNPLYALAHFNLGNLYDERGDRRRAKQHYELALSAQPSYADAHYNLALLLQSMGNLLEAAAHWQAFLKLDSGSSWAEIARKELAKLRRATLVPGRRAEER